MINNNFISTSKLIKRTLEEDIGFGDITTENLIKKNYIGNGVIIAKESGIIAGLNIVYKTFRG